MAKNYTVVIKSLAKCGSEPNMLLGANQTHPQFYFVTVSSTDGEDVSLQAKGQFENIRRNNIHGYMQIVG